MRKRSPRTPVTATPTLAAQHADFTAEGSPPPGLVATAAPVTAGPAPADKPRRATRARRPKPA